MIDQQLLEVYIWAGTISALWLIASTILIVLVAVLSKKNVKTGEQYLKNIVYSGFGGIIAVILLEARNQDISSFTFWVINIPSTLATILVFIVLGFFYLRGIDLFFEKIRKTR